MAGEGTYAGEVTFTHGKHSMPKGRSGHGIACDKCHHTYRDEEVSRRCRKCHEGEGSRHMPMKEAAHTLCMGCHQDLSIDDPSSNAPLSCPDCHVFKEEQK
jgi:predicted CXXCH cytochrome family protein